MPPSYWRNYPVASVCYIYTPSPSTLKDFTGINNLTLEDSDALASVLPAAQPMNSQFAFYLFAADLFRSYHIHQEIRFSQLAIQLAPHGAETVQLWNSVVKGLTDLALYEDAYAAVMATPFEKQFVDSFVSLTYTHTQHSYRKKDCASHLALRMCEDNAVAKLMTFDFAGVASEVEAALAFKARNADPRLRPCYSRILYTWYTRRGDYRSGECGWVLSNTFLLKLRSIVDNVPACAKATGHCHRCSILRVSCRRSVGSSICRYQRFISSGRKGCVDIIATGSRFGTNPCDDVHSRKLECRFV